LHQILISGYDDGAPAFLGCLLSQCSDNIVRLRSLHFQNGDGKTADDIFDKRYLWTQIVRHGFARGFVIGEFLMTGGGTFDVKSDDDVTRLKLAQELQKHICKTVNGIGGEAFGIGQRRNSVKSAVEIIAAVHQGNEWNFIFFRHN